MRSDKVSTKALSHLDSIDRENAATISLLDDSDLQKATISKSDSSIWVWDFSTWVGVEKNLTHRIFGYQKADTTSKRMILISVFTNDVEGNPFNCPLGSYYGSMEDLTLKYIGNEGQFIKVNVTKADGTQHVVYIERKWAEFVD
jgi:hypothetical protein